MAGKLHTVPVEITVDTGCSATLISRHVYRSIPDVHRPLLDKSSKRIQTANGARLECDGVGQFCMELGYVPVEGEYLVADIQDDILLGADILQRDPDGPADLLLSEDKMKFKGRTIPLIQVLNPPYPMRKARAVTDCVLEGCSENLVEVIIDDDKYPDACDCLLLEGHPQLLEKYSVTMAPSLANKPGGKAKVCIMNPFNSPVRIRRNTVLCYATEADVPKSTPAADRCNTCAVDDELPEVDDVPPHLRDMFADAASGLTHEEEQQLKKLLQEFADVFSTHEDDLGLTHLIEHHIDVAGAKPIKCAPRRVPLAYAGEDKKALEQLMRRGCIRPSKSPWGAPLVFVRKKDGSVRCCQDNRALNAVTVKDAYPLPRTEDCINAVSGAKLFSTMDITSAYNQIPIREDDIPKTAFTTKYGLYEHVTMPFGLCNAPASFQRLMEIALASLQWQICLIYLDDVIVFSATFDEQVERLRAVWQRIREAGLKLKPKKTHLMKTSVTFLGHVLSEKGALPAPENVEKLARWPTPVRTRDVRALLGLGNYYRKFVRGYADMVKPLTNLTRKYEPFVWSSDCQKAFETLKDALLGPEVMAYPRSGCKYILDCDASNYCLGGVLSQIQDGRERVLAYGSKTMNSAERNYCVTDRECLAVKYFCEHFKHYLLGQPEGMVTIRTDHQALKWLFSMKEPKARIARWIEALSSFTFSIEYRPGKLHGNADGMSRCPDPKHCECDDDTKLKCGPCAKCIARTKDMDGSFPNDDAGMVRRVTQPVSELAEGEQIDVLATATVNIDPDVTSVFSLVLTYILTVLAWLGLKAENKPCPSPARVAKTSGRSWALPYSADELRTKQLDDPDTGPILRWKEAEQRPTSEEMTSQSPALRHYWLIWNHLTVRNGQLHRQFSYKNQSKPSAQYLTPQSLRSEIVRQMHHSLLGGHLGEKKTRSKVSRRFYWFDMRNDICN